MPLLTLLVAAVAAVSVSYVPPVDAEVTDGFRPPSSRYGAGNRGIDYATMAGDAVRAAADGEVVYAGRIGGASHVVVLHADGIRTSYSFLAGTSVRRGDDVVQGDAVGTAGASLHFGARAGDEYLDPTVLFGGGPPQVHLVPADQRHPLHEWEERRDLLDRLRGAGGAVVRTATPVARVATTFGWDVTRRALQLTAEQWQRTDEAVRAWAHVANLPFAHAQRVDRRMERVLEDQAACTPADVEAPIRPGAGRIAVLVAGLGSHGDGGAVLEIDTAALGYHDDRVAQFSYAGGQAPSDHRTIPGIEVSDYGPRHTHRDLAATAERLRALLADIARLHPGVAVDLIAHSQGGIVVRAALSGADLWAPELPVVANAVTLGTPHHGAVLATTGALAGVVPGSDSLFAAGERLGAPTGESMVQLSSSSRLIDDLNGRGLPAGTRVTSIAASGDLTVDTQMSAIDHAVNAVVRLEGLSAHDRLPGDGATARELALALGGMSPTCRGTDLQDDLVLGATINAANGIRHVADLLERNAVLGHAGTPRIHSLPAPGGIRPPD